MKARSLVGLCAVVLSLVPAAQAANSKNKVAPVKNVLLEEWKGPYGGIPPFDKIKVADFQPALETTMDQARHDFEKIANNAAKPNFENTIAAMERAGHQFDHVSNLFDVWGSVMNTPDFKEVAKSMAPKLAAFRDEIVQNQKLFERIEAVYDSPEKAKLTPEQQRLVWLRHTDFELRGARLNPEQKKRVADINQRLATLQTQFSQNELGDEEDLAVVVDKADDLKGLPTSVIDATAAEGERRGQKGKWVIANTRSSAEPILTYSPNRSLREKVFRMWTSRGDNDNAHNNNKIVPEILKLRAERSKLLGFPTFAHWHLANTMAKDPQAAMDLMMQVWRPAVEQAHREVADMQKIVDDEKGGFKIQPWDYRFYAEKVRKAKYDLDFDTVKPYLQLDHIREAMFASAGKLWGFKFVRVTDVPVYHKDVTVYKVLGRDGKLVGLWYFDPYARAGKNSGAWMNAYRDQMRIDHHDVKTIVSNNSNFIPGKPGEPVLISWDDAVTMFHEFGHALHGLNSNVTYQSLSGTNTARDFVEFPSQFNENYLRTPEVLKFLTNEKGQTLPTELIAKIDAAKNFNQGFMTTEFLASGIVDMKLHLAGDANIDPREFEKNTLKELGMPSEIVMRHRIPQFGHIFSSEDYAAGYYGYLWAEVLDHDAYEAFTEAGNPYDKAVAKKMHDDIMSIGNTVDPAIAYRNFRGRDAKVDALLRARGLAAAPAAAPAPAPAKK